MPRVSAVFSGVATEKKEMPAFWAWPLLMVAFVVFGSIEFVLRVVGYFYRSSR